MSARRNAFPIKEQKQMTDTTETAEETASRSQMWKHEDFVEWATEEGKLDPSASQAETIAVFAANRNAYRATERYRDLVESHKAEASEAAAARKEAREAERAEKAAAKEAEKAEKAAAKEKAETTEKAPAKAAAKKVAASTKKAAAKAAADNPFD
jgi:hypothetical protein